MNKKLKYVYRCGWAFLAGQYFRCKPESHVFVLGHMRTGSSAISSVLSSNDDLFGIGESWTNWDGWRPFDFFAYRSYRESRSFRRYPRSFDKINANELLGLENPLLQQCKCVFLTRKPETTIGSILNLWDMLGLQHQTANEANDYYVERVEYLAELWGKIPAQNKVHIDHSEFSNPNAMVDKLNRFLGFDKALETDFKIQSFTGKAGLGDSTVHSRSGKLLSSTGSQYEDLSSDASKKAYQSFLEIVDQS